MSSIIFSKGDIMEIKNMTPHEVKIVNEEGNVIKTFPRSANPIRLESETKKVGDLFINESPKKNGMEKVILSRNGWSIRGGEAPPVFDLMCSACGRDGGNGFGGYSHCCGAEEVEPRNSEGDFTRIPLTITKMGAGNLPPKKEGQYYIVSRTVQEAYPERDDFVIPNETVRDKEGKIVGCRSLAISPSFSFSGGERE